jgi:hypothetical protein
MMDSTLQWTIAQFILTACLILFLPTEYLGQSRTILLSMTYIISSIIFWAVVIEKRIKLPMIFGRKDIEKH